MSNAVTIFNSGAMPAHIATVNEGAQNIVPRVSTNALTFEGKVWSINLDGKKTKLMRINQEGEEEPVAIFTGVILDYNKDRGREWYAKTYDPKNPTMPDCWSDDGKKPNDDVTDKQGLTCAACPNSKKGSSVTADGKQSVACSQFRKLAVVPLMKLGDFPPLRLRIKITSDFDKTGAESGANPGWYAFQQYLDLLVSNNVRHTALMPTKIKFDPGVAYPKLLFSPGKSWLTEEQLETVKAIAESDATKEILASTYHPSTNAGKALPEAEEETDAPAAPVPAQAKAAKAPKAAPGPAPAPAPAEDGDEPSAEDIAAAARVEAAKKKKAEAAKQVAAAAAKAQTAKTASVEADEGDGEEATIMPPATPAKPPKAAASKAAAGAAAPAAAPSAVDDIMQEWDDA